MTPFQVQKALEAAQWAARRRAKLALKLGTDPEDLVSAALEAITRAMPNYDGQGNFFSFATTVARRAISREVFNLCGAVHQNPRNYAAGAEIEYAEPSDAEDGQQYCATVEADEGFHGKPEALIRAELLRAFGPSRGADAYNILSADSYEEALPTPGLATSKQAVWERAERYRRVLARSKLLRRLWSET